MTTEDGCRRTGRSEWTTKRRYDRDDDETDVFGKPRADCFSVNSWRKDVFQMTVSINAEHIYILSEHGYYDKEKENHQTRDYIIHTVYRVYGLLRFTIDDVALWNDKVAADSRAVVFGENKTLLNTLVEFGPWWRET